MNYTEFDMGKKHKAILPQLSCSLCSIAPADKQGKRSEEVAASHVSWHIIHHRVSTSVS